MIRLNLIVEGQSEESFVEAILKEPLGWKGIAVSAQMVETSRDKRTGKIFKGGFRRQHPYAKVREHICTWIKQDKSSDAYYSTMFDCYKFPDDLPGLDASARSLDAYEKVRAMEKLFKEDINHPRFIPYIQLHEFEALLLCASDKLGEWYLDSMAQINKLTAEIGKYGSAELINDGEETAPSKRITSYFPQYKGEKVVASSVISRAIGLQVMRERCSHFDEWLVQLEALSKPIL